MNEDEGGYSIGVYDKDTDGFVTDVPLSPEEASMVKGFLGYDPEGQLCDCYLLTDGVRIRVAEILGQRLPRGAYDYFLEAQAKWPS